MTHSPQESYQPLAAFTIVERARLIAARYCGRILADLGACVLRDDASVGRHVGNEHDPIPEAISTWLDHGKPSVAAFSKSRAVDLLICDNPDFGSNDARAVVCVTPFGMAQSARPWSELVVQHASGFAFHQAMPVSDPERLPPRASSDREAFMAAGVAAALAGVWAVMTERHTVVDFSVCDFLSHLLIEAVSLCTQPRKPISRHRQPGQAIAIAGGLVWLLPCSDGDVMISPREEHQWRRWVELMGNPGWAEQADICGNREIRTRNTGTLQVLMAQWSRLRTQQEVFDAAQRARIACFPVSRPVDLLANVQLEHRGFFDRMVLPDGRSAKVPGLPFNMSDSNGAALPKARRFDAGVPTASSRFDAVHEAAAERAASVYPSLPSGTALGQQRDALGGIRVIDFSWVMAGPMCTKMMGAMGAEVIKIESSTRAEYKNRGGWFDILNNNKRSCSINITNPRGQALIRKLVKGSHVLVENFSAGVLPKYGLGYEDLRAIAPWIIYVSGSGLGRTGPLRDALAYGTLLQAFSGRCALVGTPNPSLEAMGVLPAWTDPVTAFWETLGIAAAISSARRTGRGAYIDLSMLEGTIALIPESLFSAQNLAPPPSSLNTERDAVPSGCYRCSDPDGWVALSVRSDAEWSAACTVLGMPALAQDDSFASAEARLLHRADIDGEFRACLLRISSTQAEARLRTAGVPASRSRNIFEVVDEKSVSAPGLFPHMAGGRRTIAMPWTDQHGWRGRTDAGPALGEHTDEVLGELLGLDRDEIERLKAEGAVG